MIAPKANTIQVALSQLQTDDIWKGNETLLAEQEAELKAVLPEASNDFGEGYQLGLQVGRVLVAEMFKQEF